MHAHTLPDGWTEGRCGQCMALVVACFWCSTLYVRGERCPRIADPRKEYHAAPERGGGAVGRRAVGVNWRPATLREVP